MMLPCSGLIEDCNETVSGSFWLCHAAEEALGDERGFTLQLSQKIVTYPCYMFCFIFPFLFKRKNINFSHSYLEELSWAVPGLEAGVGLDDLPGVSSTMISGSSPAIVVQMPEWSIDFWKCLIYLVFMDFRYFKEDKA